MKTKLLLKLKSISSLALLLVIVILATMPCNKYANEPLHLLRLHPPTTNKAIPINALYTNWMQVVYTGNYPLN
jgi:hypothetical protein